MSIRAKFNLSAMTETTYGSAPYSKSVELLFTTVYDMSIPEDQRFQKATPSGSLDIVVENPVALEFFKAGQSYYLDFSAVPEQGK